MWEQNEDCWEAAFEPHSLLRYSHSAKLLSFTVSVVRFFNIVEEVYITLALNTHNVRVQLNDGEQLLSYATLEFSQGDTNGNGAGNDCNIQPVHL